MNPNNIGTILKGGIALIVLLFLVLCCANVIEHVDNDEILVIQHLSGTMTVHTTAGYKWQGFGKTMHLKKSFQHWFDKKDQQDIKVRFNDGGHAQISGSVRVELPMVESRIVEIVTRYRGQNAIEDELIDTVIEKSAYMAGPLMSSKESYSERRNELLNFIEDQAVRGVYQTTQKAAKGIDPISGIERTMTIVEIRKDQGGGFLRQEESPLAQFGVKLYNLSINSIDYDATVEAQIQSQQKATMEVQTAIANSRRAEQEALTTAKQGEANAARAKWEQEVEKAKAVTKAQQQLEVAELDKKAAEQTKLKEILLGEGEATRKRLQMEANGALDPKLDAWVKVNEMYANALKDIKQPIVPSIVMAGSGAGSTSANDMIELLKVRTAQQLSLDMQMQQKAR